MKSAVIKICILMVLLITTAVATPTHWRLIGPGLEYTRLRVLSGFHIGYLYALRVDLSRNNLDLAIAEDHRNKIATVADMAAAYKAVVGVNGGLFSQELKPLGLRISNYVQRHPFKSISWWGVFYILDGTPHIVGQARFHPQKNIQFAIQSGPRLIINDQIPVLKPGADSRTAIGITEKGKIVLVVTDNLSLTTTQLAKWMRKSETDGGLACINALNLDGGSSTQLSIKAPKLTFEIPGFSAVTDAILVIPKK